MSLRLALVSLLTVGCACMSPKELAAINAKRVEPGMSPKAVEMSWGTPCEQNTTKAGARTFQRWTYCAVCPTTKAWLAKSESTKGLGDLDSCEKQEIVTFTDGIVSSVDTFNEYD